MLIRDAETQSVADHSAWSNGDRALLKNILFELSFTLDKMAFPSPPEGCDKIFQNNIDSFKKNLFDRLPVGILLLVKGLFEEYDIGAFLTSFQDPNHRAVAIQQLRNFYHSFNELLVTLT